MLDRELVRLRHMRDAARRAIEIANGRDAEALAHDDVSALAVVRLVEIIGEAAKHVSERTRVLHADIPWRQVTGMRDRLVHGYFDVDLDIIAAVLRNDLPPLLAALDRALAGRPQA